jgi:fatty-acyl-CoA synthase
MNRLPDNVDNEMRAIDTVTGLLANSAAQVPSQCAIVYGNETLTYAELETLAKKVAGGLSKIGLKAGDRIAFWLPNTVAYVALYFACARIGAIAVAINTRFRGKEVADLLTRSRARALVVWPGFRNIDFLSILGALDRSVTGQLSKIILYNEGNEAAILPDTLRTKRVIDFVELSAATALEEIHGTSTDGANVFTTSGTTSRPKLVLHTQRGVARHATEVGCSLSPVVGDGALLQSLPFCGVFGFVTLVAAVAMGRTMVITSSFDAAQTLNLIEQHRVRYLNATDDMVLALLRAETQVDALPNLVCCGFGAFNAPPHEVAARAQARGVRVIGVYGMSEVMALFSRREHTDDDSTYYLGGGNLVSPEAEVRVRNPDTLALLPRGESGELEVKGPSLMREYLDDPEATARAFTSDGFFKTGDLGYVTGPATFVYQTRLGDTLRLAGIQVSPVEIESHLCEHPDVAKAQVVAVRVGDRTRAYAFIIAARDSVDIESVRAHCVSSLASFKVPIKFRVLAEFPTIQSANGTKIQRTKLRQMAATDISKDGR